MPFYPPAPGSYRAYHGFYPPNGLPYPPYVQPYPPNEGSFFPQQGFQPFMPYRQSGLRQESPYFAQGYPPQQYGGEHPQPNMWRNINNLIANVHEISNGINTLRQMGSMFSNLR